MTQKPDGQRKPHFLGWKTTDQEEIERRRLRALSVGLNSQAANVVINLDLPWNPARLEQRIARAWRKHQTRPVSVINLVSQRTIEHRMLGLLEHKQELADEVVDGRSQ